MDTRPIRNHIWAHKTLGVHTYGGIQTYYQGIQFPVSMLYDIRDALQGHIIEHYGCRLDWIWLTKRTKTFLDRVSVLPIETVLDIIDNDDPFFTFEKYDEHYGVEINE